VQFFVNLSCVLIWVYMLIVSGSVPEFMTLHMFISLSNSPIFSIGIIMYLPWPVAAISPSGLMISPSASNIFLFSFLSLATTLISCSRGIGFLYLMLYVRLSHPK
jgi:hypothetical protein